MKRFSVILAFIAVLCVFLSHAAFANFSPTSIPAGGGTITTTTYPTYYAYYPYANVFRNGVFIGSVGLTYYPAYNAIQGSFNPGANTGTANAGITAQIVYSDYYGRQYAFMDGQTVQAAASMRIVPKSLTFTPNPVVAGKTTAGTLTLSGPAPTGGAVVPFTIYNAANPSSKQSTTLTVPAGKTAAIFYLSPPTSISAKTVEVYTATYSGVSVSTSLTINPATSGGTGTVPSVTTSYSGTLTYGAVSLPVVVVVSPTVTTLGATNGINARDVVIMAGNADARGFPNPWSDPQAGSVIFATNLGMYAGTEWADSSYVTSKIDDASSVTAGANGLLSITVDGPTSYGCEINAFNIQSGLAAMAYGVNGGTISMQFANGTNTVSGNISLAGRSIYDGGTASYTARFTATRQP